MNIQNFTCQIQHLNFRTDRNPELLLHFAYKPLLNKFKKNEIFLVNVILSNMVQMDCQNGVPATLL